MMSLKLLQIKEMNMLLQMCNLLHLGSPQFPMVFHFQDPHSHALQDLALVIVCHPEMECLLQMDRHLQMECHLVLDLILVVFHLTCPSHHHSEC